MKRSCTLVAAISVALATGSTAQAVDLQEEMEKAADQVMSNTTQPGTVRTMNRHGYSGGSFVARTDTTQTNLISMTPLRMDAGCGGIDLHGGSFSHVDSEQFKETARNVINNASGYAFQLGLEAVAPSVNQVMESIQSNIQSMNQFLGDSCQMAQGIVEGGRAAMNMEHRTEATLGAQARGFGDDIADAWRPTGEAGDSMTQMADDDEKPSTYNLAWRAMREAKVGGWFTGSDEEEMLQVMMSLTGTTIISKSEDEDDELDEDSYPPLDIDVNAMVEGGKVEIYECTDGTGSNECKELETTDVELDGMAEHIKDMLLAEVDGKTLPERMAEGGEGVDSEQREQDNELLLSLPYTLGGDIANLARLDPALAEGQLTVIAPALSVQVSAEYLRQLYRAIRASAHDADFPKAESYQEMVDGSQDEIREQLRRNEERRQVMKLVEITHNLVESASAVEGDVVFTGGAVRPTATAPEHGSEWQDSDGGG